MGVPKRLVEQEIVVDIEDWSNVFLYNDYFHSYGNKGFKERPLWTTEKDPDFITVANADTPEGELYYTLMNIPIFTFMANTTFDDLILD